MPIACATLNEITMAKLFQVILLELILNYKAETSSKSPDILSPRGLTNCPTFTSTVKKILATVSVDKMFGDSVGDKGSSSPNIVLFSENIALELTNLYFTKCVTLTPEIWLSSPKPLDALGVIIRQKRKKPTHGE